MELHEVVHRAQLAMEQGDYGLAVAACSHALATYPTCIGAHRTLAEALLELGQIEPAIEHFNRTLELDPLNIVARLGLGVASEEQGDVSNAYQYYISAWDLNPALDQLRDELARLQLAQGLESRLHPTRAGLASIMARSGQYRRAAAEWRAVGAADASSDFAVVALAEVLWRQGDDDGAVAVCHQALAQMPENARVLALLTEIEHRRGGASVAHLLERYQAVDPAGDLVLALSEERPTVDMRFMLQSVSLPDFVYQPPPPAPVQSVPAAPPRTTGWLAAGHLPAPDLWDTLVRDLGGEGGMLDDASLDSLVIPFEWNDGDDRKSLAAAPESIVPSFAPSVAPTMPVMGGGPGDAAGSAAVAPEPWPREAVDVTVAPPAMPRVPGLADQPPASAMARSDVAESIPEPLPPTPSAPSPGSAFITDDGRIDLTVGWDDLDRVLDEATPTDVSNAPFNDILAEIDAGGIAPFSTDDTTTEADAWEPFADDELSSLAPASTGSDAMVPQGVGDMVGAAPTDDELFAAVGEPMRMPTMDELVHHAPAAIPPAARGPAIDEVIAAVAPPIPPRMPPPRPASVDPLATIAENWDHIDQELEEAIPPPRPTGYTDILRNIDQEGIIPFGVVDPDAEVDPLANPDAVGQPLEFDDLLTVTSRDDTDNLPSSVLAVPTPGAPPPVSRELPEIDHAAPGQDARSFADKAVPSMTTNVDAAEYFADLDLDAAELQPFSFIPEPFALPPERIDAPMPAVPSGGHGRGSSLSNGAPDSSSWPSFIGGTSELIDRDMSADGLFDRLRDERDALVATGELVVDLSLDLVVNAGWTPDAARFAFLPMAASGFGAPEPLLELSPISTADLMAPSGRGASVAAHIATGAVVPRYEAVEIEPSLVASAPVVKHDVAPTIASAPGMRSDTPLVAVAAPPTAAAVAEPDDAGLNLSALRKRVKLGPTDAKAVIAELEAVVASGQLNASLARILGEAYLKLGRGDQAAAQFRQAIALRGRRR